jgi:hypothetical protein
MSRFFGPSPTRRNALSPPPPLTHTPLSPPYPPVPGPAYRAPAAIEQLVQSVFPDTILNRKMTLADIERTIAFTEGLDNQL